LERGLSPVVLLQKLGRLGLGFRRERAADEAAI
jgi:hypothetical protein